MTFRLPRYHAVLAAACAAVGIMAVLGALVMSVMRLAPTPIWLAPLDVALGAFLLYYSILLTKSRISVDGDTLAWTDDLLRRHEVPLPVIRGIGLLEAGSTRRLYILDGKRSIVDIGLFAQWQRLPDLIAGACGLTSREERTRGPYRETYYARDQADIGPMAGWVAADVAHRWRRAWVLAGLALCGLFIYDAITSGRAVAETAIRAGVSAPILAVIAVFWRPRR